MATAPATRLSRTCGRRCAPRVLLLGLAATCCGWLLACCPEARGADADQYSLAYQRDQASRALGQASDALAHARAAAEAAKRELDEFVAAHFEQLHADDTAQTSPADEAFAPPQQAPVDNMPDPLRERLLRQMDDLSARRDELLDRLTEAHPEVVDVSNRLAELKQRVAQLDQAAAERAAEAQRARDEQLGLARERAAQRLAAENSRREAAETYQQLFGQWQLADAELQAAEAAYRQAAERLESQEEQRQQAASPAVPLIPKSAASPPLESSQSPARTSSSQPLALASLMLALAVAAWAAVKLARASSDTMFSSVEDVAAALALPVVGVISSGSGPASVASAPTVSRRLAILAAQLIVAVLVFMVVAYVVQHAGWFGHFVADPSETLRGSLPSAAAP